MSLSTLAVFAKAPIAGRVKTRLAATLGETRAVAIYRELAAITARALAAARADRHLAWYDPPDGEVAVRELLGQPAWDYRAQCAGDLGARMERAFQVMLAGGGVAVLVGTDCPAISPALLEEALDRLRGVSLVLGPATDGGYYLIGLSCSAPALFRDMAWSTQRVLADTLARARQLRLPHALLPEHGDVDTEADYRAWRRC